MNLHTAAWAAFALFIFIFNVAVYFWTKKILPPEPPKS